MTGRLNPLAIARVIRPRESGDISVSGVVVFSIPRRRAARAKTGIESPGREGGEKSTARLSEFHVHPCRASLRFRRLCAALTRFMHESSGSSGVYFCPDTLFPVPAFPPSSLPPLARSLTRSLSLFSLSRPSWRFPPISSPSARPAAVSGCRLPSSVSPASHRPVMSCLPPLASSPAPRHNLPQTLKRPGCFARRSHSTSSGENTVSSHPAIAELHYHNSRARGVFGVARKSQNRAVSHIYIFAISPVSSLGSSRIYAGESLVGRRDFAMQRDNPPRPRNSVGHRVSVSFAGRKRGGRGRMDSTDNAIDRAKSARNDSRRTAAGTYTCASRRNFAAAHGERCCSRARTLLRWKRATSGSRGSLSLPRRRDLCHRCGRERRALRAR